jgi:hypothetical protein
MSLFHNLLIENPPDPWTYVGVNSLVLLLWDGKGKDLLNVYFGSLTFRGKRSHGRKDEVEASNSDPSLQLSTLHPAS